MITSGFRAKKLDAAVLWEPTASRLILDNLAREVATGASVNERDGGFMVMPQALIEQRPDVVKAWLEAELDAELYFADPKNAADIAKMAAGQTTGFPEKALWLSAFGRLQGDRRRRHADRLGLRLYAGRARAHFQGLQVPRRDQEHQRRDQAGGGGAAIHRRSPEGTRA